MKQQKKMQEEALREQKRCEKEDAEAKKRHKRQEKETLEEQKRREKEEAETRKQQKRQQEEAENEQKRLEKQASLMQRFFKSKDSEKHDKSGEDNSAACSVDLCTTNKEMVSAATSIIDSSFSLKESWTLEYLQR